MHGKSSWYEVENADDLFSPSLLVYPGRIEFNIRRMIEIAGSADRLRPHVKTHKMPEVIKLQMNHGISKFKCATISEAEMTAACGARDILLAMQPVGPNIERFFNLRKKFPGSRFSCLADTETVMIKLSERAVQEGSRVVVWLDINNGMNRTGIIPGKEAARLYKLTNRLPGLTAGGIHVYDGHIHDKEFEKRKAASDSAFSSVTTLVKELEDEGSGPVKIVAGGSPTFPVHALRPDVELSPGTLLLWDWGYGSSFADMDFRHAAVLFSRVVSKPAANLVCLDLGHKAVGSEMVQPRVMILGMDEYKIKGHSEEHMVIETASAETLKPGDALYALPWHICPTVDRYDSVYVVNGSRVESTWRVEARTRKITI